MMGKSQLSLAETVAKLNHVAVGIEASKDILTEADIAIGDGDHGIGMARGFEAVRGKLATESFTSLDQLFKTVGTTLMGTMGGASGAIFGTLFRGGSKQLVNQTVFTSESLALLLGDGLQAIKERGKAKVGDKTMVDALEPAALKAKELSAAPLDDALPAAAEAARQGMEYTKTIVATMGRAKTLGERALGHPDPGAVSMSLILNYMAEYVTQNTTPDD